ncbi:MAG: hypothetical protein ABSH52_24195 [Terriglobia bacterium]
MNGQNDEAGCPLPSDHSAYAELHCRPPGPSAEEQRVAAKLMADPEARRRALAELRQDERVESEESDNSQELYQAIRACVLDKETPAFDKRRRIAALVREELVKGGFFCRTSDHRLFYFLRSERQLYDLDQRPFQHLLASMSGLSATETYFRFVLDSLQTETGRGRAVEVYTLAHFDLGTGYLTISDGCGGVWRRERGGAWEYGCNGDNGLLFFTESEAEPWTPEFRCKDRTLDWFLDRMLLSDHGELKQSDQKTLFLVYLLAQFFPGLRRTRLVPAFLGPQGSGKTSAMRMNGVLFLGNNFDVTGLHRDREDAFIAAVSNRVVVALDNADTRVPWLENAIATYATGLRYRLRRLYSTNEELAFEPRAIMMLSSRDPHFQRPDVAERLLPLRFERPEKYISESVLFQELSSRRGVIWGELLMKLATIADDLGKNESPATPFRMADFASFGWQVFNQAGKASEWLTLLKRLEGAQMNFASEGDGLIAALRTLIEREGKVGPLEVGELFRKSSEIAEVDSLPMSRTVQGFGMKLTNMRRVIEVELGVKYMEERRHKGKRFITLIAPGGDTGETGDTISGKVASSEGTE